MSMLRGPILLLLLIPLVVSYQHNHAKPRITRHITNQTVVAGARFAFTCTAKGTPAPSMVINRKTAGHSGLSFPGAEHRDVEEYVTVERVFDPVTLADQGWYKCYALNQRNIASSQAYLSVEDTCESSCSSPKACVEGVCTCERECSATYNPVCASNCQTFFGECQVEVQSCNLGIELTVISRGFCSGIKAPRITVDDREVGLVPGTGAVVSVTVEGYPEPSVTWYKDLGRGRKEQVGEGASVVVQREGTYFAEAVNCLTKLVTGAMVQVTEVEELTEEATEALPDELNFETVAKLEDMKSCTILGGSHVITFDRWMYEFDGVCTYVLAMDCNYASWFVYVRYMVCETGRCLESVSITDGRSQIQLLRGWAINNGYGQKFKYQENVPFTVRGIAGLFDGLQLTMTIQNSVYVVFDGYSVVQVFVAEDTNTCGLCSNNDGNNENDIEAGRSRYQTSIDIANFADSWKVRSSRDCTDAALLTEDVTVKNTCTVDPLRKAELRECRKLYQIELGNKCVNNKELKFLYESCRYDACYGENPLPGYANACYTAQAIANLCGVEDMDLEWEEAVGCSSHQERSRGIVSVGCPAG